MTSEIVQAKPAHPRSPHWHAVRAMHLHHQPTCQACGGSEHLEVHHRLPYHLHPELELDPANLITLCEGPCNCHLCFGHLHSWKAFNVHVTEDVANYLDKVVNRPYE